MIFLYSSLEPSAKFYTFRERQSLISSANCLNYTQREESPPKTPAQRYD